MSTILYKPAIRRHLADSWFEPNLRRMHCLSAMVGLTLSGQIFLYASLRSKAAAVTCESRPYTTKLSNQQIENLIVYSRKQPAMQ
ncbi:hypothetical protein [Aquitalea sp.]|uniref:hypothetical protein n=1 Tax=Aquitalea sp. TaxID=1872623 RepID=UPI002586DA6E|nr:hypothetical protein [Aquitalea sp.]